jgi:16S rRNA (cytidine1402-2'-O)-methyltransferase
MAVVEPGLHIVATPIGNLADITLRALAVLSRASIIACEDSRITGKLKSAFGFETRLQPYHEHNARRVTPTLIKRLEAGEIVALVSDAGTPLLSDPGYRLVNAAIDANLPVFAVPGASAALAALVVSGLPTDKFLFAGFLPPKSAARRKALEAVRGTAASLIFYESPKRLTATLRDMNTVLGDRQTVIARELTKKFEEIRRGTLGALAEKLGAEDPPRGEVTIIVAPPAEEASIPDEEIDALLLSALEQHGVRGAADEIAAVTGRGRRDLYQRALQLRGNAGGT